MVAVSSPFVDKLSLCYQCDRSFVEGLKVMIDSYRESQQLNLRYKGAYYRGSHYKNNWQLILNNQARTPILLQFDSKYPEAADFCIEWNPNDQGIDGNRQLWTILEELLAVEYEYFLAYATVSRLDLAVDVSPLTPDAIWVEAEGLHRGDIRTGRGGRIETYYLGSRESNRYFCIYNRNPDDGQKISSDKLITRIETRLETNCTLAELGDRNENPFSRLTIAHAFETESGDIPWQYRQFIDSIRVRGLQGALRLIPRYEIRRRYKSWIQDNLRTEWFNPDEVFAGYREALDILALPMQVRMGWPSRRRIIG
jgi:hypothetical protein